MQTQIEELQKSLPKLGPRDQEFASDLISYYYKWHKLSSKQEPWIGKLIERSKQVKQEPVKIDVGGFEGVVALFDKAKAHLKYPKIVLSCAGTPIILSVAGSMSKAPGSINIVGEGKYPERAWFGRVSPKGEWTPSLKLTSEMQEALKTLLTKFGNEPARVAKQYGKLTGNCCFCASQLTDKRSTAAGFGPVCAGHFGLMEEWKTAVKKMEEDDKSQTALPLEMQKEIEAEQVEVEKVVAFIPDVVEDMKPSLACFLCGVEAANVQIKNGYPVCMECAKMLEM